MKYTVNIIVVIILVVLIAATVNFTRTPTYRSLMERSPSPLEFLQQLTEVVRHNITMDAISSRNKPTANLIEKETLLIQLDPDTFSKFNREDWDNFWKIIYEPIKDRPGFFEPKRFRTKEELISYFTSRYYRAFSDFGDTQWDDFLGNRTSFVDNRWEDFLETRNNR